MVVFSFQLQLFVFVCLFVEAGPFHSRDLQVKDEHHFTFKQLKVVKSESRRFSFLSVVFWL